jgi:hypothetical protein
VIHGQILTRVIYMAGFMDGEGCIRWDRGPRVEVTNTHRGILEEMQKWFGGSIYASSPNAARKCYRLVVGSDTAIELLSAVLPYLCVKRLQAQTVLDMSDKRRAGCLSKEDIEHGLNTLRVEKAVAFDIRSDEECGL